ncbi:MAG: YgjV family protein [Verrucomicrobia bacterium]|nr:YgjV family protein [Verrucomicrobiota bacterium]
MDHRFLLELLGYVASVLIAVSLMMSSILRLRLINMAGALAFAVYGVLIGSYPVAVLNSFTVLVNIFFLVRIFRAKEYFQLLQLQPDSVYLPYFLKYYRKEIQRAVPDFEYHPAENQLLLFILRDCNPVGVFIAEQKPDGVLRVLLDFVVPRYRNLKIGRFLFVEQAEFFQRRGVREIVIAPRTAEFGAYLVKVGFAPAGRQEGAFNIHYAEKTP